MYAYLLQYDENTIGCEAQFQYLAKQSKEESINNFCGAMSSLYFLQVSVKTIENTNAFLSYVKRYPNFLDNFEAYTHDKRLRLELIENVFMLVNPKYTKKLNQDKQKVLTIKINSKYLDIYNKVEQLYKGVKIYQHISPENNFVNLGEMRVLLPVLYIMGDHNLNQTFV